MTSNKSSPDWRELQQQWAAAIRNPNQVSLAGVEPRRLAVYQRLVFNNIDSFISRGFPVLRQLHNEQQWQQLIYQFMQQHAAQSPLFADIGREFVAFAQQTLPGVWAQLAQYERMEVDALYAEVDYQLLHATNAAAEPALTANELLDGVQFRVNPSAQLGVFQYPVQQVSAANPQPPAAAEPVCLVVYRELTSQPHWQQQEAVKFMQLTPLTMVLLETLQQANGSTLRAALASLQPYAVGYQPEQLEQALVTVVDGLMQRCVLFLAAE